MKRIKACLNFTFALAMLIGLSSLTPAQQNSESGEDAPPRGTPILWRAHARASSLDLFWGQGGRQLKPDLRKLTFIKEEKDGHSTKYRVRDASGRVWVAKIGREAQSETASTRLLWAAGYMTEITYLVPRAHIPTKGEFENVRFEARPAKVERAGEWKWEQNPFIGTREFQGLKVMMVVLNNWDVKDENNVVMAVQGKTGTELRYAISDLGATLGVTGRWPLLWRLTRSRNDPKGYSGDKLIDEIEADGRVNFEFWGKNREMFNDITVEQAKWAGGLLAQLHNQQLTDAFRAANYNQQEMQVLVRALRSRINQLVRLQSRIKDQEQVIRSEM